MKVLTAIRKSVKWGGAVAFSLIVAVWVASVFGRLYVGLGPSAGYSIQHGQLVLAYPSGVDWTAYFHPTRITYTPISPGAYWSSEFGWGPQQMFHNIPLWWSAVLVLLPTAFAWWLDRRATHRAPIGCCPACGYARAGLAAGTVCPECGTAPAAAKA